MDSQGGGASAPAGSSPVSSAVRSLNSLSDFTLDVSNGNYADTNGSIPSSGGGAGGGPVDSLLSGASKSDHSGSSGSGSGGPLMDFKSAFSDMQQQQQPADHGGPGSKSNDLGFLHLDMSQEDIQRTLQARKKLTFPL